MSDEKLIKDEEMLGVVVSRELYGAIVAEAGKRRTSVSGVVRQLLQEGLGLPIEVKGRRSRIAEQMAANLAVQEEQ